VRATILFPCLLSLLSTPALAGKPVTQADLLRRLIDLDQLLVPPPPGEQTGLFSSFDRRQLTIRDGRYAHWDANNDRGQFLRSTADGWNVMAEIKAMSPDGDKNKNMADALNGFKAMGAMAASKEPELGELMNRIEIVSAADHVKISAVIPEALIESLGQKAMKQKEEGQEND